MPALHLPARPRVGARWAGQSPAGAEIFAITAVDAFVDVPAGAFGGCVEVVENPEGQDRDIVLFAPGVGVVREQWAEGEKVLVEHRRPR